MAAKQMMQMFSDTTESDEEKGIYVVEEEDENNIDTGTKNPDNDFHLEIGYNWIPGHSSISKRKQLTPFKALMDCNVEDISSEKNKIEQSSFSDESLTDYTTKVAEEEGEMQSVQVTNGIYGSGESGKDTPKLSGVDKIEDTVSCDKLSDNGIPETKITDDCDNISKKKLPNEMTSEAERNVLDKENTENVSSDILRIRATKEIKECAEEDDDHTLDEVTVEPELTEDMNDNSRNDRSAYPELVAESATDDEFVVSSLNAKDVSSLKTKDKEIKKRKQLNPERFTHASALREKEKKQDEKASPETVNSKLEKTIIPELGKISFAIQKPKLINVKNKRREGPQRNDDSPIPDKQGKYFSFVRLITELSLLRAGKGELLGHLLGI